MGNLVEIFGYKQMCKLQALAKMLLPAFQEEAMEKYAEASPC